MKRLMTARVGGRYIVVPKLVGLVLVLVALLFFFSATIDLIVTWDKIKDVDSCIKGVIQTGDEMGYLVCSVKALAAGVYPYTTGVDKMDVWAVMASKAAAWAFWVVVLIVALLIYYTGRLFEIEEEVVETKEVKEEKEKGRRGRKRTTKKKA